MSKLTILSAKFIDANERVAVVQTSEGERTVGDGSPEWQELEAWRDAGGSPSSGYEIVSARWANPDHTAAELMTAEFGSVLATMERPELWLRLQDFIWTGGNEVAEFVPAAVEAESLTKGDLEA